MKIRWVNKEKKRISKLKAEALDNLCTALSENGLTQEQTEHMKNWCLANAGTYKLSETFFRSELARTITDNLSSFDLFEKVQPLFEKLWSLDKYCPERFLDSKTTEFDGDIIITDPCYISKENDWPEFYENPPMSNYMIRDTIYGDWSCSCWNTDSEEILGQFCADAGLVGVFSRDEVRQYNPDFEKEYANIQWGWTLIKDFKGTVQFVIKKSRYKSNHEWHDDFSVQIHGHGINKQTGEPINFLASQTGI